MHRHARLLTCVKPKKRSALIGPHPVALVVFAAYQDAPDVLRERQTHGSARAHQIPSLPAVITTCDNPPAHRRSARV